MSLKKKYNIRKQETNDLRDKKISHYFCKTTSKSLAIKLK